ncbi:MAG: hypothetical protein ACAH83_09100 [Alphaproteobacteria bacterium]
MKRIIPLILLLVLIAGYLLYRSVYVPPFPCIAGDTVGQCIVREIVKEPFKPDNTYHLVYAVARFGSPADITALKDNLAEYIEPDWVYKNDTPTLKAVLEAATGNVQGAVEIINDMARSKANHSASQSVKPQMSVVKALLWRKRVDDAVTFLLATQRTSFLLDEYKNFYKNFDDDSVSCGKHCTTKKDKGLHYNPVTLVCGALMREGRKADAVKLVAAIGSDSAYFEQVKDRDLLGYINKNEQKIYKDLDNVLNVPHFGEVVNNDVFKWALNGENEKVMEYVHLLQAEAEKNKTPVPASVTAMSAFRAAFATGKLVEVLVHSDSTNLELFKELWPDTVGKCVHHDPSKPIDLHGHRPKVSYPDCLLSLMP